MKSSRPSLNLFRWLLPSVPAIFGCAALYAFNRIRDDGFVKTRQRSWPIQHIYSASENPLMYYGALLLCLAWAGLCFWLAYRLFKGPIKNRRSTN